MPVSSLVSLTAACVIDSPRSIAPPGTAQFWLSDRRMSKTSPAAFVTITLTDGTRLVAAGAAGSSQKSILRATSPSFPHRRTRWNHLTLHVVSASRPHRGCRVRFRGNVARMTASAATS